MTQERTVRAATLDDAAACAAIYAPYVRETAISFETSAPTPADFAARIRASQEKHAWLVLEEDGRVVGYAYAGAFAVRAAYRWTCESSIYLEQGRRRTGAGRALYAALLPALAQRGYRRIMAGATQPNEASMGLHRAFGFEEVARYRKVGWKNGSWHDVAWMQLNLTPDEDPARAPDEIR